MQIVKISKKEVEGAGVAPLEFAIQKLREAGIPATVKCGLHLKPSIGVSGGTLEQVYDFDTEDTSFKFMPRKEPNDTANNEGSVG